MALQPFVAPKPFLVSSSYTQSVGLLGRRSAHRRNTNTEETHTTQTSIS
jgi:hypothetical protein